MNLPCTLNDFPVNFTRDQGSRRDNGGVRDMVNHRRLTDGVLVKHEGAAAAG